MQIQKLTKKEEGEKRVEEGLEGYAEILQDIKSLLEKARYKAYKAVDNLRVQTYWQIGERIVRGELQHRERADYGERVPTAFQYEIIKMGKVIFFKDKTDRDAVFDVLQRDLGVLKEFESVVKRLLQGGGIE